MQISCPLSGGRVFCFNAQRSENSRPDAVGGPDLAHTLINRQRRHHYGMTKNRAVRGADCRFWHTRHSGRHGHIMPELTGWAGSQRRGRHKKRCQNRNQADNRSDQAVSKAVHQLRHPNVIALYDQTFIRSILTTSYAAEPLAVAPAADEDLGARPFSTPSDCRLPARCRGGPNGYGHDIARGG